MSQYFSPHTARRSSVASTDAEGSMAATVYLDAEDSAVSENENDFERSIYIFPNPTSSSTPSILGSPFASSSVLSVPTDISFPSTPASGDLALPDGAEDDLRSGRRRRSTGISSSRSAGGRSSWDYDGFERSVSAVRSSFSDSEVEVWEWSGASDIENDNASGVSSDIETAELEAAIERANRWVIPERPTVAQDNESEVEHRRHHPREQQHPLHIRPSPNAFAYAEGRFQFRRHMRVLEWNNRTASSQVLDSEARSDGKRSRTISMQSTRPSVVVAPYKIFRIPLLSFFASLLSLDDKTLSLLTRPSCSDSSPLFDGPQLFIEYNVAEMAAQERDKRRRKRIFGESETDVLKQGVEMACDPSIEPENRFILPLPSIPLGEIWSFVSSVCRAPTRIFAAARA